MSSTLHAYICHRNINNNVSPPRLSGCTSKQRNNMYMSSGIVGNSSKHQNPLISSPQAYFDAGRPNKRRRATTSNKTPQAQQISALLAPIPTAYPAARRKHRAPDSGIPDSDLSPRHARALPDNNSVPPYISSLNTNFPSIPTSNESASALPFSPHLGFSPLPRFASLAPSPVPRVAILPSNIDARTLHFDPLLSIPTPYDQPPTSEAGSTSGGSIHTDSDSKDPFLCLLEQLAENEASRGGPSELDYLLSGQCG